MDIKAYIASGILELYVAGLLSEQENLEVHRYAQQYPEIQSEIEAIEAAILALSKSASPNLPSNSFDIIKPRLGKVVDLPKAEKKSNWPKYLGWVAAVIFAGGLVWMYLENEKLKNEIEVVSEEKRSLEEQILDARNEVVNAEELLNQLRDQNVAVVALGGQAVSPESFAKAYWNKAEQKVYIDAQSLPEPPPGFTYQVWSLKLNPLTPTSIGLLDDFANNETGLFELPNPNESEAFGITLEPEGGSESPTLDQLYTLGIVS
ncbi:anti-sigma factor [Croceivirga thetidis]|uniref:Anti-sigma factor n=1 Tax=Croceivirga thetidis TaxID=2721623 RepID=A0ABX1GSX4_9FLAO|nr:anti-sigma factor [Croceivirga thetidis]NKI32719.1 anti-sigma factor [Croceivirga thetidis]